MEGPSKELGCWSKMFKQFLIASIAVFISSIASINFSIFCTISIASALARKDSFASSPSWLLDAIEKGKIENIECSKRTKGSIQKLKSHRENDNPKEKLKRNPIQNRLKIQSRDFQDFLDMNLKS